MADELAYIATKAPHEDFITVTCIMDECNHVFVLHEGWVMSALGEVVLNETITAMLKEHTVANHEAPHLVEEAERILREAT